MRGHRRDLREDAAAVDQNDVAAVDQNDVADVSMSTAKSGPPVAESCSKETTPLHITTKAVRSDVLCSTPAYLLPSGDVAGTASCHSPWGDMAAVLGADTSCTPVVLGE